jgi:hypothetical protein
MRGVDCADAGTGVASAADANAATNRRTWRIESLPS